MLEQVVADESQLAAATRSYVWRVRNSPVRSLVRLLAEQGRQIERWVEDVRGHAGAFGLLGAAAPCDPLQAALAAGDEPSGGRAMIAALIAGHERLAQRLRDDLAVLDDDAGDREPTGLLSGLLEFHQTTAWMLRLVLDVPAPRPVRELAF